MNGWQIAASLCAAVPIVVSGVLFIGGVLDLLSYKGGRIGEVVTYASMLSLHRDYRSILVPAVSALMTGLLISISASYTYAGLSRQDSGVNLYVGFVLFALALVVLILLLKPIMENGELLDSYAQTPRNILAIASAIDGSDPSSGETLRRLRVHLAAWQRSAAAVSVGFTERGRSAPLNSAWDNALEWVAEQKTDWYGRRGRALLMRKRERGFVAIRSRIVRHRGMIPRCYAIRVSLRPSVLASAAAAAGWRAGFLLLFLIAFPGVSAVLAAAGDDAHGKAGRILAPALVFLGLLVTAAVGVGVYVVGRLASGFSVFAMQRKFEPACIREISNAAGRISNNRQSVDAVEALRADLAELLRDMREVSNAAVTSKTEGAAVRGATYGSACLFAAGLGVGIVVSSVRRRSDG